MEESKVYSQEEQQNMESDIRVKLYDFINTIESEYDVKFTVMYQIRFDKTLPDEMAGFFKIYSEYKEKEKNGGLSTMKSTPIEGPKGAL